MMRMHRERLLTRYRESILAGGVDDHDEFVSGPYRTVIWHPKQKIQLDLLGLRESISSTRSLGIAWGTCHVLERLKLRVATPVGFDVSRSKLDITRSKLLRSERRAARLSAFARLDGHKLHVLRSRNALTSMSDRGRMRL